MPLRELCGSIVSAWECFACVEGRSEHVEPLTVINGLKINDRCGVNEGPRCLFLQIGSYWLKRSWCPVFTQKAIRRSHSILFLLCAVVLYLYTRISYRFLRTYDSLFFCCNFLIFWTATRWHSEAMVKGIDVMEMERFRVAFCQHCMQSKVIICKQVRSDVTFIS